MATRRALRDELVRRGLVKPEDVESVLASNRVRVNGSVVANATRLVAPGDAVSVVDVPSRYVSRGGAKLEGALVDFGLNVEGWACVDAGASTGGFTDCLLQHGAAHVVAVDVGRAQIHNRLVTDSRVTSWESRNILDVGVNDLVVLRGFEDRARLVVADLSFTSSARLASHLVELVGPGGNLLILVKPQFEAHRDEVPAGGVVEDPEVHERSVSTVCAALLAAGCEIRGSAASRVPGADGNREFFVWGTRRTDGSQ